MENQFVNDIDDNIDDNISINSLDYDSFSEDDRGF